MDGRTLARLALLGALTAALAGAAVGAVVAVREVWDDGLSPGVLWRAAGGIVVALPLLAATVAAGRRTGFTGLAVAAVCAGAGAAAWHPASEPLTVVAAAAVLVAPMQQRAVAVA